MGLEGWVTAGGAAVGTSLLSLTTADQGGIGLFSEDDARIGAVAPEDAAHTHHRSAGPVAGDEVVEPLPGEIRDDLPPRRGLMDVCIGLGFELPGEEPPMCLC